MFGFTLLGNLCIYVWSITNWTAILYMKYVAMKKGGFRFFFCFGLRYVEWECLSSDSL